MEIWGIKTFLTTQSLLRDCHAAFFFSFSRMQGQDRYWISGGQLGQHREIWQRKLQKVPGFH